MKSIVILIVLIESVEISVSRNLTSASCYHNKSRHVWKCEVLENCATAIQELNEHKLPQTCGFENRKTIVCCSKNVTNINNCETSTKNNVLSDQDIVTTRILNNSDSVGTDLELKSSGFKSLFNEKSNSKCICEQNVTLNANNNSEIYLKCLQNCQEKVKDLLAVEDFAIKDKFNQNLFNRLNDFSSNNNSSIHDEKNKQILNNSTDYVGNFKKDNINISDSHSDLKNSLKLDIFQKLNNYSDIINDLNIKKCTLKFVNNTSENIETNTHKDIDIKQKYFNDINKNSSVNPNFMINVTPHLKSELMVLIKEICNNICVHISFNFNNKTNQNKNTLKNNTQNDFPLINCDNICYSSFFNKSENNKSFFNWEKNCVQKTLEFVISTIRMNCDKICDQNSSESNINNDSYCKACLKNNFCDFSTNCTQICALILNETKLQNNETFCDNICGQNFSESNIRDSNYYKECLKNNSSDFLINCEQICAQISNETNLHINQTFCGNICDQNSSQSNIKNDQYYKERLKNNTSDFLTNCEPICVQISNETNLEINQTLYDNNCVQNSSDSNVVNQRNEEQLKNNVISESSINCGQNFAQDSSKSNIQFNQTVCDNYGQTSCELKLTNQIRLDVNCEQNCVQNTSQISASKETSGQNCTSGSNQELIRTSVSILKCWEYAEQVSHFPPIPIDPTGIIGGVEAGIGDFPHMAALGFKHLNETKWLCGGSLISDRFILTAAHCLVHRDYGNVTSVRLGEINMIVPSYSREEFGIARVLKHPEFNPAKVYHDIALLELDRLVVFSIEIHPACLNTDKDLLPVFQDWEPTASGWGLTEYGGEPSKILQRVNLQMFTIDECSKAYNKNRKLHNGIQPDKQICAGGRDYEKDTCQGDSGGPLQIWTWHVRMNHIIGVTSFGRTCGVPGIPAIYTNVLYYISWIESIVWP